MNKSVIIVAALLLLLALFWWAFQPAPTAQPAVVTLPPEPPEVVVNTILYNSIETQQSISVAYVQDQAVLDGVSYEGLSLTQTESASGARYLSADGRVAVWNKGDMVTVYENDEPIFEGQATTASEESVVPVEAVSSTTSSTTESTIEENTDGG